MSLKDDSVCPACGLSDCTGHRAATRLSDELARAEKLDEELHQAKAEWHEEKKRAREMEKECLEQARLLGMGGQRELALMAERDRLAAEVEKLETTLLNLSEERIASVKYWRQQLDLARAESLVLVGALNHICRPPNRDCCMTAFHGKSPFENHLFDVADIALAQSPNAEELSAAVEGMREALGRSATLCHFFPPTHVFQVGSDAYALQGRAIEVFESHREAYRRFDKATGRSG